MTDLPPFSHLDLARRLAARFGELPQVEAVALTGSLGMGVADAHSDIDLYVYIRADIPVSDRMAVAIPYASDAEFDNQFWGTADSWHDLATGIRIEGLYWWVAFIEGEMDRVLHRHEASIGYSTAFWHSVQKGRILFDRNSWLHLIQAEAMQPYPEQLRRAIVAKNHPILRAMSSSYLQQIKIAVQREDFVSINHRTAALLASYFDILFALNRLPHPGEKRLLRYAERDCTLRPPLMREQITALVSSAIAPNVVDQINTLLDGLDALLITEGFDPTRT
jgi:predicted nucleotidyltransferase